MPNKYILKYLLQQGEVGKNRYENWGVESLNSVYSIFKCCKKYISLKS